MRSRDSKSVDKAGDGPISGGVQTISSSGEVPKVIVNGLNFSGTAQAQTEMGATLKADLSTHNNSTTADYVNMIIDTGTDQITNAQLLPSKGLGHNTAEQWWISYWC